MRWVYLVVNQVVTAVVSAFTSAAQRLLFSAMPTGVIFRARLTRHGS